MSAPAAKTFSPPYTMTARTSSSAVAAVAAARSSSCTCALSAFIGGRSKRMVPIPSCVSKRTNSPIGPPCFRHRRRTADYVVCMERLRSAAVERTAMTTYYRDDHIVIDSFALRIDGQTYHLDDLSYVWHQRGVPDMRAMSR